MQVGVRLPVGFIAVLLLAVPGLVGLEVYHRLAGRSNTLSRTRLVVFSTIVSLASLLVLYFGSPLYLATVSETVSRQPFFETLPTESELSMFSLPVVVSLYLVHSTAAVVIGGAAGFFRDRLLSRDVEQDRRDPWQYAFEDHRGEANEIVVILSDGSRVAGSLIEAAWDGETRELYVSAATAVESDETLPGELVVLTADAISHVYFVERDPNLESETSETGHSRTQMVSSNPERVRTFVRSLTERVSGWVSGSPDSQSNDSNSESRVDTEEFELDEPED